MSVLEIRDERTRRLAQGHTQKSVAEKGRASRFPDEEDAWPSEMDSF